MWSSADMQWWILRLVLAAGLVIEGKDDGR